MALKTYQFKVNAFDVQTGEIEGYANTFNFKDYANDITMPGAFTNSLKAHKANGTNIKMLWQHNTEEPIGLWTEAFEDEKGLYLKGHLILGIQKANEVALLLNAGAIDGLSIGYTVINEEYSYKEDANLLLEVDVHECSAVLFPCNSQSRIESVKSKITPRELEKQLRKMGMSQKNAKSIVAKSQKELDEDEGQDPVTTPADVMEILVAIAEAIPDEVLAEVTPDDVAEVFEEALDEIVSEEKRKARKARKTKDDTVEMDTDTVLDEIMEILDIVNTDKTARKETLNTDEDLETDGMSVSTPPEDEDFLKSLQSLLSAKSKTGRSKLKAKINSKKK